VQKKYQRQTREQWQTCIEQFHRSGMSGVQFCHTHDIPYASFCKWRQRFSSVVEEPEVMACQREGAPPAFINLQSLAASDRAWKIVLRLGSDIELLLSQP
jgi:putative transposase